LASGLVRPACRRIGFAVGAGPGGLAWRRGLGDRGRR